MKRALAFIIDYILFFIPTIFLFFFIFMMPLAKIYVFLYPSTLSGGSIFPLMLLIYFALPCIVIISSLTEGLLVLLTLPLSFLLSYSLAWTTSLFLFEFFFQRTIGKFFTHLKVCNLDGSRISFFKSFARNFIKFFFFVTLPFLLLPFWGSGTQGLHDKICRTKVIDAPKYSKKMHILQYVVVMIIIIIFLLAVYWFVDAVWLDLPFL